MALKITIDHFSEFKQLFAQYNRENNFSPSGLKVLFNYLNELSDSIGEDIEIDIIGLCVEYNELTIDDIVYQYNIAEDEIEDYLNANTVVCGKTESSYIFVAF